MWETIQFILVLFAYILGSYFATKQISKWTLKWNVYLRLLILSFSYALFWGVGIAFTGGDPGFAFPFPNLITIGLMGFMGFYWGILTGLAILGIWWILFFVFLLVRNLINKKKQLLNN
ncbi:MAG TPA: hypothetical protein DCQ50_13170 [Chryseobacterium sp.]|nr:hypothetical protein [Chryseobacterium sp.]